MNKTVAFVLLSDLKGGAETVIQSLHSYKKSSSVVYFISKQNRNAVEICNFYYLNEKRFIILGVIKILFYLRKIKNYDYIFTTHLYLNSYLGLLKKLGLLTKPKLIFRESTSVFQRNSGAKLILYKLAYRLGYGLQKLTICQSDSMKNQILVNVKQAKKWPIITIPNPIDLYEIINKSSQYEVESDYYIVAAGRLIPEKGFDILIKSFNQIRSIISSTKLFILGEGSENSNLQFIIDELELTDRVILLGFIENPIPYFKKAGVCVVSSVIEGFPNVLLQMMAVNNHVVSTLCAGGIDELDGVIKCKPNDINSLSEGILRSLNDKNDYSEVFKKQLEKRSVGSYWNTIESLLDEE